MMNEMAKTLGAVYIYTHTLILQNKKWAKRKK